MTGVQNANFLLNRQLNCFMQCNTKNYQHICEPTQEYVFYELILIILFIEVVVLT